MSKLIGMFNDILNNFTLLFIVLIGLATLLIDGPRMRNKGFARELSIVKAISYSYIGLGIIMFILLRII